MLKNFSKNEKNVWIMFFFVWGGGGGGCGGVGGILHEVAKSSPALGRLGRVVGRVS